MEILIYILVMAEVNVQQVTREAGKVFSDSTKASCLVVGQTEFSSNGK